MVGEKGEKNQGFSSCKGNMNMGALKNFPLFQEQGNLSLRLEKQPLCLHLHQLGFMLYQTQKPVTTVLPCYIKDHPHEWQTFTGRRWCSHFPYIQIPTVSPTSVFTDFSKTQFCDLNIIMHLVIQPTPMSSKLPMVSDSSCCPVHQASLMIPPAWLCAALDTWWIDPGVHSVTP